MIETEEVVISWLSILILKISPTEIQHQFRLIEKTSIKIEEAKCHLSFNECCYINKLLPNYTKIRYYT